ncbi:MAG: DUF3450 family protein [Verrucomicrobiota bacterium]
MTRFLRSGVVISGLIAAMPLTQANDSEDYATLLEWVRVEKQISEERADWNADKAILLDLIRVLEEESKLLDDHLTSIQEEASEVGDRKDSLEQRSVAIEQELTAFNEYLTANTEALVAQTQMWPRPILKDVEEDLESLNKAPSDANESLAHAKTWLSLFRETHTYQNQVVVHEEMITLDDDQPWAVNEIYFGFAGGFWTTPDGERGGRIIPEDAGWRTSSEPELAPFATRLIDISKRREAAAAIEMPLSTQ